MMPPPPETGKLLVYVAADLARKRQGRGLKLNVPESVALIAYSLTPGSRNPLALTVLGREAPDSHRLSTPKNPGVYANIGKRFRHHQPLLEELGRSGFGMAQDL